MWCIVRCRLKSYVTIKQRFVLDLIGKSWLLFLVYVQTLVELEAFTGVVLVLMGGIYDLVISVNRKKSAADLPRYCLRDVG